MNNATFTEKRRFIVKLGKMLHKYGTPAYRLEAHLMEVATHLGLKSSFVMSPTSVTFVIWTEGHEEEYTHVARVDPGDHDLGSLADTDDVATRVLSGELSIQEAEQCLEAILHAKPPYNKLMTGLAFATSGGAFAMLMGTSWNDVWWSALLSLVVYLFVLWASISKRVTHMLEPLVAIVSAVAACAVSVYIDPQINIRLVVLSAIIVFIPGLALALGFAELSARHLVSGTARVMDSIMLLFKLYFGAFLGISLGFAFFGQVDFIQPSPLPRWTAWLAVLLLCSSLVIIFRTKLRHASWSLASGFIAYAASISSAVYFDYALGTFVGAFAVGVFSNIFNRVVNAPASIVAMQGLIVLVPGSKTYIGLNSLIEGQSFVHADHIGQQTFLIFMSLIAGLIFSNVVLPPKKSL
ncbi:MULTISPECIES: threonine/serine exporter ThrE family protein [Pseudoalteromonas]|uniref:threonine/serine ThrE exporter family protein n=1 Tax=Pseudoalteromonas TaxID=53246 RepID=UPI00061EE76D|nr:MULTISPECIES: threonine/serine exporter family protein [Pseudoalteromonas]KJZ02664.1 membrane protein [Pseudoalteromonas piscicida]MCG7542151.1 threonine/serine exporter family protein [Pseudoalteromonas sp. OF7H-1]MCG9770503.1 threonine/serine exporter family protein [Pseudoalteromonas piscicida]WMO16177.1 threonine/serine exporter family protein [Pseudoalteromonas piscicida]